MAAARRIHVVAGVLVDDSHRVLIQRRAAGSHQEGLWEFPGGKLEPGERHRDALARELREELGIVVDQLAHLVDIDHDYPDLHVCLSVWWVTRYRGKLEPLEGQPLHWARLDELEAGLFPMPAADEPVVAVLRQAGSLSLAGCAHGSSSRVDPRRR